MSRKFVEPPRYPGPIRWAYGVTAVPKRRDTLLPETLLSLRLAGFDRPRLFVDGEDDPYSWKREFGLEVTAHSPTLRTYGNWVLAMAELYIREPEAERYAIFQDDVALVRNLRTYLDACEYPGAGYWNLFTFFRNEELVKGKAGWVPSDQRGLGALALVFDRPAVLTLLTHQHMVERPQDPHRGWRAVDGGIVTALRKAGYTEYVHAPSLVQHTGTASSMGNKPFPPARTFPGEGFDAATLIPPTPQSVV